MRALKWLQVRNIHFSIDRQRRAAVLFVLSAAGEMHEPVVNGSRQLADLHTCKEGAEGGGVREEDSVTFPLGSFVLRHGHSERSGTKPVVGVQTLLGGQSLAQLRDLISISLSESHPLYSTSHSQ
jgi:hypothetical protein